MTLPTTPPEDPTAAELAALRKEKADRDTADKVKSDAEAAERAKELEELRAFKAEQDKKPPVVRAPEKKIDKVVTPETVTEPPVKKKRRVWWPDAD